MKKILGLMIAIALMLSGVAQAGDINLIKSGCIPFLKGDPKTLIDPITFKLKNDTQLGAYSEGCGEALQMKYGAIKGEYVDKKWGAGKRTELSYATLCRGFYKTVSEIEHNIDLLKLIYFVSREVYQTSQRETLDRAEVALNVSSFLQKNKGLSPSTLITFDKYIDSHHLYIPANWKRFLTGLFGMDSQGVMDVINTVSDDDIMSVKQACVMVGEGEGGN